MVLRVILGICHFFYLVSKYARNEILDEILDDELYVWTSHVFTFLENVF